MDKQVGLLSRSIDTSMTLKVKTVELAKWLRRAGIEGDNQAEISETREPFPDVNPFVLCGCDGANRELAWQPSKSIKP